MLNRKLFKYVSLLCLLFKIQCKLSHVSHFYIHPNKTQQYSKTDKSMLGVSYWIGTMPTTSLTLFFYSTEKCMIILPKN